MVVRVEYKLVIIIKTAINTDFSLIVEVYY
jgi:hypothetical protein